MSDETLNVLIKQFMEQTDRQSYIGWQGGEPTLMGLDFFQKAVDLEKKYGRDQTVANGLQTNGVLLNRRWARFLRDNKFLIGLSLDGPEHIHDRYRKTRVKGTGTWEKVEYNAKLMLDEGAEVNALCVVNDYSVNFPEELYSYYRDMGLNYMQFIPCVETGPDGMPAPFCVPPKAYGHFLCRLFDCWLADFKHGRPSTSIRFFDSIFYHYAGMTPPECIFAKECGLYVVVEHNGDVFPCDFFVEEHLKLGNIKTDSLSDMLNSPEQTAFGASKSALPAKCLSCNWLKLCRGGCLKDRIKDHNSIIINHLCESYEIFFSHADQRFRKLAAKWKEEQRAAHPVHKTLPGSSSTRSPGRNGPCPCGSGLKYKKCCMNSQNNAQ